MTTEHTIRYPRYFIPKAEPSHILRWEKHSPDGLIETVWRDGKRTQSLYGSNVDELLQEEAVETFDHHAPAPAPQAAAPSPPATSAEPFPWDNKHEYVSRDGTRGIRFVERTESAEYPITISYEGVYYTVTLDGRYRKYGVNSPRDIIAAHPIAKAEAKGDVRYASGEVPEVGDVVQWAKDPFGSLTVMKLDNDCIRVQWDTGVSGLYLASRFNLEKRPAKPMSIAWRTSEPDVDGRRTMVGQEVERRVVASTGCEPIVSQPGNVNVGVTVHCNCGSWPADVVVASQAPQMSTPSDNIVATINYLRADEGDSVTILCDNPDFNGLPNSAIECSGEWTYYKDERFAGHTLQAALEAARKAKAERKATTPPPPPQQPSEPVAVERFYQATGELMVKAKDYDALVADHAAQARRIAELEELCRQSYVHAEEEAHAHDECRAQLTEKQDVIDEVIAACGYPHESGLGRHVKHLFDDQQSLITQLAAATTRADEAEAEIEAAWQLILSEYDIESRELMEREAKTNGFKYGLAQAVHTIWKRDAKVAELVRKADEAEAGAVVLREALEKYHYHTARLLKIALKYDPETTRGRFAIDGLTEIEGNYILDSSD